VAGGDRRRDFERATARDWALPALAFVLIAGASVALALRFGAERDERIRLETEIVGDQVARRLSIFIDDRLAILAHLAEGNRSGVGGGDTYRREAQAFIDRLPGIQALNWVGASGTIEVVVPLAGNEAALHQRLSDHPNPDVRRALARARATGRASRTAADIEFFQGGRGFAVYQPVRSASGELRGFLNGVFRVQDLIDACLSEPRFRERFHFTLSEPSGLVAYRHGRDRPEDRAYASVQSVDVVDQPWQLRLTPSPAWIASKATPLPGLLLAGGLGLAVAVSWLLRSAVVRHAALRSSEQQIRLLLDSTLEGIYGLDESGHCTFSNPACSKLLGYSDPSELVGRNMHELVHHSRRDGTPISAAECSVFQALRQGRGVHLESEHLWRKDGTSFEAEVRAHRFGRGGRTAGAVVTFTDVTARRQAGETQHRLTAILEATPDLVGICDRDGRSIYMNRPGRAMLGIGPDAPLGERFGDYHSEPSRRRLLEVAVPIAQTVGSWTGENTLLARDGTEIPISQVVIAHAGEDGEIAYYSTIGRDMRPQHAAEAERELLEAEFRQAQKSESLGLLAGGIAHDFNNLLVAVLGNATLVLEDLPEGSPLHRRVQAIQTSAERASELTQQLLTFAGRNPYKPKPIDLSGLVGEMTGLLEVSISKRIRLDCHLDGDALRVMGDASQLRQVVMNLITNAAEAIGDGAGAVTVRVESGELAPAELPGLLLGDERAPGRYTWLEVEDTGTGMDEELLDRIFDPFFTTKFSGRGLGLSAVLGIVSGHGGLLSIRSRPSQGTCFRVLLPATEAAAAPGPGPAARRSVAPQPGGRVLVVDDEASVRRVAVASLVRAGFEATAVGSGEEAIERFEQAPEMFDAVLLDLTMPGMDGLETLAALHAIRPDLPAVLTSGFDASRISSRLDSAGRARFLQKPYRVDALVGVLAEVMAEPPPGS